MATQFKNIFFGNKKVCNEPPRVVKFSGGRSSGMMLLKLLKQNKLETNRGDCVIFCNTSAEHKATYAFVARIKHICEDDYNIPFFMIEYKTYEVKNSRGYYVRRESYRLVNEYPYSDNNTDGYHYKGEVFEELISNKGTLPSVHQRTCTVNMKVIPNNLFLIDYWTGKNYIEALGHGQQSKITPSEIIKRHKKYGGKLSDTDILIKKDYILSCATMRYKQCFQDYTQVILGINNEYLSHFIYKHSSIKLIGKKTIKFISYLGIRHDEKHRIDRIRKRIKSANKSHNKTQPNNEIVKAPLIIARVNQQKVIEFWQEDNNKKYDLVLPYNGLYSNCVFCFLKGKTKKRILAYQLQNEAPDTPTSINWWSDIETKFSRKQIKKNNNGYTHN